MNPFAWSGPKFLLFYVVLAAVIVVALIARNRMSGRDGKPVRVNDLTTDPYAVAYLRGGATEAARVAIFNLVDRGILAFNDGKVRTAKGDAAKSLRRPLDRAIVAQAHDRVEVNRLAHAVPVRKESQAYAPALAAQGLVPNDAERRERRNFVLVALAVLIGVSFTKIAYAFSHGRSNVGFLVLLTIVSCVTVIAISISMGRRTGRGSEMLDGVKTLLRRLRDDSGRLKAGGATNEALLLAAAFGLAALPAAAFPVVEEMFPRPQGGGGDSGGSSSDGGSSGCGGGGGCGGCGGG